MYDRDIYTYLDIYINLSLDVCVCHDPFFVGETVTRCPEPSGVTVDLSAEA